VHGDAHSLIDCAGGLARWEDQPVHHRQHIRTRTGPVCRDSEKWRGYSAWARGLSVEDALDPSFYERLKPVLKVLWDNAVEQKQNVQQFAQSIRDLFGKDFRWVLPYLKRHIQEVRDAESAAARPRT